MGYTNSIQEAGKYSDEEAERIAQEDIDRRTVPIDEQTIKNILR